MHTTSHSVNNIVNIKLSNERIDKGIHRTGDTYSSLASFAIKNSSKFDHRSVYSIRNGYASTQSIPKHDHNGNLVRILY